MARASRIREHYLDAKRASADGQPDKPGDRDLPPSTPRFSDTAVRLDEQARAFRTSAAME
jgi:hypothetical protein